MKTDKIPPYASVACPSCTNSFVVKLEDFNSENELVCPNCGLKIVIKHGVSDKAAKILDKLKNR